MKKCVLLLSGGLDSTITIKLLQKGGYDIYPLFIDYNQIAISEEITAAKYYVSYFKINKLEVFKTAFFNSFISPILKSNQSILTELKLNKASNNYLPYRNLIFAILASSFCIKNNSNIICFGFPNKDNWETFPDTSPEFIDSTNKLFKIIFNETQKISIISPGFKYYKKDLVRYAYDNKIALNKTYSCYESKRCSQCESCLDAIDAIEKTGLTNNNLYNPYIEY